MRHRVSALVGEGRPAWVVDLAGFRERCASAASAARAVDVTLLMAVKACSDERLLTVAAREGLGFDCSNLVEVDRVRSLLEPRTAVSLTAPAVPGYERSELLKFISSGQRTWANWHSLDQLMWACHEAPAASHGLRLFAPECAPPELVGSYRQSRFGVRLDHISDALSIAAERGARVSNLHVHNGSGEHRTEWYEAAARTMLDTARGADLPLERVNLGGGLQAKTGTELSELLGVIRGLQRDGVEFVLEPGGWWYRGLVWLAAPVLEVTIGDLCNFVVIDAGAENHRRWSLPVAPNFGPTETGRPHVICGRTCSEKDYFAQVAGCPDAPVPQVGDWVVLSMSSYSLELQSSFGGLRPLPAIFAE
ncbi:lysine/ornithine decarboxylase [Nonomuraea sp. TT08I-71]|nr:lysine/ornithine decarboxylase [Nonomuraea sp. TT08I-71]